ncbi:caspase family protein [Candidatus Woesearchaeota archaeon]|nr:caspase family protein [Candidatus Woesearchaeota archaeon]
MYSQRFLKACNRYALLIGGSGRNLTHGISEVARYLCDAAGFDNGNVVQFNPQSKSEAQSIPDVMRAFYNNVRRDQQAATIFLYHGHGEVGCIRPFQGVDVPYEDLAGEINYDGPLLVIIDACHSASALPVFHKVANQVHVSCGHDQRAWRMAFLPAFFYSMVQRRPFRRRRVGSPRIEKQPIFSYSKLGDYYIGRLRQGIELVQVEDYQHPQRAGSGLESLLYPR